MGFGECAQRHGVYHSWGRAIEGLSLQVNMATKKVLKVVDTGVVPVPTANIDYEGIPENPRPHTTPISISQPAGPGYKIENGEISWQNWLFRVRLDQRIGTVLNLVRFVDKGQPRSILYEASVSELFVPYMDPSNGWNNRVFVDAGEFYATGFLAPLRPGVDCPADATWFDGLSASENGAPKFNSNQACLFERDPETAAWRHFEDGEIYGRPTRQLVLRSAATIGNYDYIMDWRFDPDRHHRGCRWSYGSHRDKTDHSGEGSGSRRPRCARIRPVRRAAHHRCEPRSLLLVSFGLRCRWTKQQLHDRAPGAPASCQRPHAQIHLGGPTQRRSQ